MNAARWLVVVPELGLDPLTGAIQPGGVQQVCRTLLRSLAESEAVRHVTVLNVADPPRVTAMLSAYLASTRHAGLTLRHRAFHRRKWRLALAFLWAEQWRHDRLLFMHVNHLPLSLFAARPFDVMLYGIDVWLPLAWPIRRGLERAERVLSISRFTTDQMRRYNPTLQLRQPATIVHLGVEMALPAAATAEPTAKRPAVLIVARMSASERYKGHDALITGWPLVRQQRPDAELWIVGGGDDVPRLKQLAHDDPSIRFLGRVSHDDLQRHYREASVFAMPSLGEGFGLVFVEAMQHGLPCICSHDAAAEIVLDGVTGLVVDQTPQAVAEACARLLCDATLARTMGDAGRERALAHFQPHHVRHRFQTALGLAPNSPP